MKKKELFNNVLSWFNSQMPVAETELQYHDPYQLLVAVILSAQCTDKRVNIITSSFFKKFPDVETLASAAIEDVYEYIKSCSYPNNKAKNLSGMAKTLKKEFGGIVPDDINDLQKLPGVGRKTAHVIASVIFHKPVLAVDTHVFRVASRIGLSTNAKTTLETEKQLMKYIPIDSISKAHHWLILHGRYTCKTRNPLCESCGINQFCRYYKNNTMRMLKKKL